MDVPIFSVNDTVLVVAVLECLLLGALLLFFTQIPLAQRLFLSLFLLSLGVDFLDTLIYWAEPLKARWLSDHLYTFYALKPLGLMAAPALYLYLKSMLFSDFNWCRRRLLHFAPALLITLLLPFYLLVRDEGFFARARYDYEVLFHDLPFQLYLFVKYGLYFTYGLISYRLLATYHRHLEQGYSNLKSVDPWWLRLLVIGFMIIWSLYLTSYLSHLLFEHRGMANLTGVLGNYLNVFFITSLVVYSLTQSQTFRGVSEAPGLNSVAIGNEDEQASLAQSIHQVMREQQLYLDPELSLERLASTMGLSSKLVSSIINRRLNKNFFEYVNDFRTERAKSIIAAEAGPDSMMQVMEQSGFNSKSTFNRCFKRATGMTPSEYRENIRRSPVGRIGPTFRSEA
ncbi:AraC family transcriptional regulator [Marinimicrobium sp. LS-A18]|uniref:helix-turn-helix domain-containing protein n=1 Tax=Marinimicrobium sp. LS-A18 TaxID=1381596 RepID=UPI00046420D7|nr:AraC family transcriptional regulator [Marinimicrobium sp. LS-A18]